MFGPYLSVLRRPGAARFSAAGMLARLQASMVGIGAIMLLSAERGSYAVAGTVSAIYALSGAAINPQVARLIDSIGQRRVVLRLLTVHIPAVALMIVFAVWSGLNWPLYVLALIAGSSQPIIGPLVRTRWSVMLVGSPELKVAFAWESLVDELVFIIGPPLATVLALALFPSAALIAATTFLVVGTYILMTQRSTEPAPSGRKMSNSGRPAIAFPGVAGITGVFVLLGGIFGALEVTTVGFAKEAGHPGSAGLLLALYSFASLTAGLIFGVLVLKASLLRQFAIAVTVLAVATVPLPFLHNVWLLGGGLMLAGLACSPVLICGVSLLQRLVPGERLTEAISWTWSGLAVGTAISAPVAGYVIDASGASVAYWVTSGCAIGTFVVGGLFLRSMSRAIAAAQTADVTGLVAAS